MNPHFWNPNAPVYLICLLICIAGWAMTVQGCSYLLAAAWQ